MSVDWSDAKKFLRGASLGRALFSAGEMPSTQIPAKEAARRGAPHGAVWVTDFQSAGRGRRDRGWHGVPGRDLTFSALLRPDIERRHAPLLCLASALAVARAVGRAAPDVPGVAIKWPNDVLAGERAEKKICGIICESAGSGERLDYAVVGIGVNVNRTADELPELDSPDRPGATSLRVESGKSYDLPELLAAVLTELDPLVAALAADEGRREVIRAYAGRCATLGKKIRVVTGGEEVHGTAADIAPSGMLIVETEAGTRVFDAADVVHVRKIGVKGTVSPCGARGGTPLF